MKCLIGRYELKLVPRNANQNSARVLKLDELNFRAAHFDQICTCFGLRSRGHIF